MPPSAPVAGALWRHASGYVLWLVPLLFVAASAALLTGLSLPVIRIHKFFFWDDEYSVLGGIANLFAHDNIALGIVIALFSVFFPAAKLLAVGFAWVWPLHHAPRQRFLRWTSVLGRWSMLDVFVVAVIVVMLQSSVLTRAEPRPGIYVFAAAIVLSMLVALLVEHIASRYDGSESPAG